MTLQERFLKNVNKTGTCWLWTGGLSEKGYGRLSVRGKNVKAHRVSLQLAGVAMPPGMVVDHVCRIRSCVNPEHLRVVTNRQNTLENSNSIMADKAKRTHCPRGHELTMVKVKDRHYRTCIVCKIAQINRRRERERRERNQAS